MITTYGNTIRDDAYGVNTDSQVHWTETLLTTKRQEDDIRDLYKDFLNNVADICGLDTSEWDHHDWWELEDIINDLK